MADMCVIVQAIVAVTHQEMWQSTEKRSEGQGKDDWKQDIQTIQLCNRFTS